MEIMDNIKLFLKKQKIEFNDINLFRRAFTHSSFVHETNDESVESYERLEFLGDSVLGKIIAEYLFKTYKEFEPGELSLMRSKIVCKDTLSKIGKEQEFKKLIFFGKGEANKEPSNSVYEDVVESFIGALYLDQGNEFVNNYVLKLFEPYIVRIKDKDLKDYKTQLQEELQARRKNVTYKTIKEVKSKQGIEFHVNALLDNQVLGFGKASSRKEAEQQAAKDALSKKATEI